MRKLRSSSPSRREKGGKKCRDDLEEEKKRCQDDLFGGEKSGRASLSISSPGPRQWGAIKTLTPNPSPRGRGDKSGTRMSACQGGRCGMCRASSRFHRDVAAVRVRDGLAGVARRGEVWLRGGLACRGMFLTCERTSHRVGAPGAEGGGGGELLTCQWHAAGR